MSLKSWGNKSGLFSQLWCCHKCDRLPKTSQPAMWLKHMIIVTRKTCTKPGLGERPPPVGSGGCAAIFFFCDAPASGEPSRAYFRQTKMLLSKLNLPCSAPLLSYTHNLISCFISLMRCRICSYYLFRCHDVPSLLVLISFITLYYLLCFLHVICVFPVLICSGLLSALRQQLHFLTGIIKVWSYLIKFFVYLLWKMWKFSRSGGSPQWN